MIQIEFAKESDIEDIAEIEKITFPPKEACSLEMFKKRYKVFPECFIVAKVHDKIIGFIEGGCGNDLTLSDDYYSDPDKHNKEGKYQYVYGIAVLPEYQRQGVGSALMKEMMTSCHKEAIILTCKDAKLPFYESLGFIYQGISDSTHGDEKWNDMILYL